MHESLRVDWITIVIDKRPLNVKRVLPDLRRRRVTDIAIVSFELVSVLLPGLHLLILNPFAHHPFIVELLHLDVSLLLCTSSLLLFNEHAKEVTFGLSPIYVLLHFVSRLVKLFQLPFLIVVSHSVLQVIFHLSEYRSDSRSAQR